MDREMYLLDLERTIQSGRTYFWKPARQGYTTNIIEAGLYSFSEASDIVESDFDQTTIMISLDQVKNAMKN